MVRFLRKLFLIDFVLAMFKPKQNPHVRFAGFLQVFSFLWLAWAALLVISLLGREEDSGQEWTLVAFWVLTSIGFFFFYRYTGKVLKGYSEEDVSKFGYLRYLNPIAPIIYCTTVFLMALAVINMLMLILLILGVMIYIIGIIVTLGLLLMDKSYKMSKFTAVPDAFFKAEEYFLQNVISPEMIIVFLILTYFVVPMSASFMILWQHHSKGSGTVGNKNV